MVPVVLAMAMVQGWSWQALLDAGRLRGNDAEVAPLGERLEVRFKVSAWPNASVGFDPPEDWSSRGGLVFEVENPGSKAVPFSIRIDDAPQSDGVRNCVYGTGSVPPGARRTFWFPLGKTPMDYGMRAFPSAPGREALGMPSAGTIDFRKVHRWQIFLNHPTEPCRLVVGPLRFEPWEAALERICDRFGQYGKADWPGKLKDEAELRRDAETEEAQLARATAPAERNRFGGWTGGPRLRATGRFRTEKVRGKWWLVDPEGRLFFSFGANCVGMEEETMVTGREGFFEWLPKRGEPLSEFLRDVSYVLYGPVKAGTAYSFSSANLRRKYGEAWRERSLDVAVRRLRAWGMNTVGNWSHEGARRRGMPYVATFHIDGDHARVSSGSDYWGKMHDVFDPKFAESVQRALASAEAVVGDPYCIGWFVDNELSWGGGGTEEGGRFGLAYGALRAPADQPAKRELLRQLRVKYRDVSRLNEAWGTSFASWRDLEAPGDLPSATDPARRRDDLLRFCRSFADRYFQTVRDAVKAKDPGALYLGPRFAWRTTEAVESCARYADCLSFNIYAPSVKADEWAEIARLDKPILIGEFHMGATDRGMFHPGLVGAPNQQARAELYGAYVRSVLDHPNFVGCHWFQYRDQPLTGRVLDGECYNIGLVTVVDRPYPEMVEATRRLAREMYRRRYGN
ncbi:MAG: beta-galactosidase [Fimbriimonadales bacterium]|nr:beta-galactosidase [Fimbriimonadales bacterium]